MALTPIFNFQVWQPNCYYRVLLKFDIEDENVITLNVIVRSLLFVFFVHFLTKIYRMCDFLVHGQPIEYKLEILFIAL